MNDVPNATVTRNATKLLSWSCDGTKLLSWSFEFPRKKTRCANMGWIVKETIGPSVVNTRGITEKSLTGEDMADRRRDDNLREMFGG